MERTASSDYRLLRAVILLPLAIAAFVLVFLSLGGDDARASGLSDVLDSTTDTVSTAVSGVAEVATTTTNTTKEVVRSVATPPTEKPVTAIVTTVVVAVPTVTNAVTTTTTKSVQAATATVKTVATPVVDVVDPIVDGVIPGDEAETPVVLPTPIAVVEAADSSAVSHAASQAVAPLASDVVAAFVATSAALVLDTPDAAALAPAPVNLFAPLAPTPLTPAPIGGTLAVFAGAITLLAVLGARPHLLPAAGRRSPGATDDELPSTPTFDTDSSPD